MNIDLSDIYEKYPKQPNNDPMVFYKSGSSVKPHGWKTIWYSDLSHDCRTLINDLVQSSRVEVVQRWDDNFRREYYTKVIAIAYDLGKEYNKNIFAKIKEQFLSLIKWRTWN